MRNGRWSWVLDLALLFLLTTYLLRPYWKVKYNENWSSIESTFIADARMLRDHWPRPLWQPYWYVGTRFDYIYPPALRYGTAAIAKYTGLDPAKSYHIYVSFFYGLGIAGVYFLARVGLRHRGAALAAALATLVVSPSYLVLPKVARDMFWNGPARLNVLIRYGEGPHMTALAWIPFVLAFTWLAWRRRSWSWSVAAGFAATFVVANNFYGATALAMLFPVLVWALWVTERDWRLLRYPALVPLLAYGLSAFWLTPSYLKITLHNMQYVSSAGSEWSAGLAAVMLAAYLGVSYVKYRDQPERTWHIFLFGSLLFFTVNVIGNYYFNFRVIGEPMRLVPELDLLWIYAILLGLLWLWRHGRRGQIAVGAVLLVTLTVHSEFLRHPRAVAPPGVDPKATVYWRIPEWVAAHYPNSRTYVTGAVRFWYNTWHDLYQLGGSSEQGLQNPNIVPLQWEIILGRDPRLATAWLQLMGVDLVAVHGPDSEEAYKDFTHPKKFDGHLKEVYSVKDDHIYEVPRRDRSLARILDRASLDALPKIRDQVDLEGLEKYVAVYEQGPGATAATAWKGTDELNFEGRTEAGQSVILQTTYDPSWRAESNLGLLPVTEDRLGFVRIDTPPGVTQIRLVFEKPLEKRIGEWLFFVTLLGSLGLLWRDRRRTRLVA
ncbi:hypothetical protein [Bryobacter aggregatus]|uniref:hypothetical protein n=1 Tax=Bryobacter aggregatus TaxID=360054 RepID=UPI0004E23276|nr:hypothetical protein [Bryobacter aggregatus]